MPGGAALQSDVRKSRKLPDRVLKNRDCKCHPLTCPRLPRCQDFSPLLPNLQPRHSATQQHSFNYLFSSSRPFICKGMYAGGTNTFLQINIFISLSQKDKFRNWSGCALNCIPNHPLTTNSYAEALTHSTSEWDCIGRQGVQRGDSIKMGSLRWTLI